MIAQGLSTMAGKTQFGSRIGLIAATVGSAVGLGNVWRFPAEAQANGGAAFLLIYIVCVAVLGIPVMLAEFSLGRGTGRDAVASFQKLASGKKWWLGGAIATLASYLILSFYIVVAGWTLEYLWESITGGLYSGVETEGMSATFKDKMGNYITGSWEPLLATYAVIALNIFVLLKGVQKGIEKMSNILMPALFLILVFFCIVSLSLPDASRGLDYFFSPDFSKITAATVVNALGQAFFSLSLGMGILITYSAYYPKTTNLVNTSFTVSILALVVAVLMGMIIFPAVMSFGLDGESLEGAILVFVTLPEVFASMPFTRFWSALFFLLLLVAAVTSTISLAEVSIAFVDDRFKIGRKKACWIVMLPLIALSSVCSLSQGVLSHIRIFSMNIFDFLDSLTTNLMLPISALITCFFVGWIVPLTFLRKELTNKGRVNRHLSIVILPVIRYVAPILIAVILIAKFLE